jgi:hypothetical protein
MESASDPQNWRIKVSQQHIELYLELADQARPLTAAEARMKLKHAMERR